MVRTRGNDRRGPGPSLLYWGHPCTPQVLPHTHHFLAGLLPIHEALGDRIGCQELIPTVDGGRGGADLQPTVTTAGTELRGTNSNDNNKTHKKNERLFTG